MTKNPKNLTDEEVFKRPEFQTMRDMLQSPVTDRTVLSLTREALQAEWNAQAEEREKETLTRIHELLLDLPGAAKASRAIIGLAEEGVTIELIRQRTPSWDETTYAEHIHEEPYTKSYKPGSHQAGCGEYRLEIAAGRNENETVFMRLTEPSGKTLQFPPANEEALLGRDEDGKRVADADVVECTSISRLLRDSSHKTTLSVWQYFGLKRASEEVAGVGQTAEVSAPVPSPLKVAS